MITATSAPTSTLAFDHIESAPEFLHALADISPDIAALWKSGPIDPGAWLQAQGWNPHVRHLGDEATRLGRPVPDVFDPGRAGAARNWLVTADR
jgi:hypothetical protein